MRIKAIFFQLLINGVGKGVGFVREVLISGLFGVSSVTDAFFSVQQVFVFFNSYMTGAFNLAFVPAYVRNQTVGAGRPFLMPLVLWGGGVGFVLTVAILFLNEESGSALLGFRGENAYLLQFLHVFAWTVLPTVLIGIAFGVLHGEQKHQLATFLGVSSSVGMVSVLLVAMLLEDGHGVSPIVLPASYLTGVLLAGAGALAVLIVRLRSKADAQRTEYSSFFRSLFASSIENIGFNFNQITNVYFAARLGDGLVAINAFAFRVGMLPLALFSSQLGQIYQAWVARVKADGGRISPIVFFALCIPNALIALAMASYGEELVRLIYERGEFTSEHTALVAALVVPYSAYFFVMSVNQLAARHLFVLGAGKEYSVLMIAAYAVAFIGKLLVAESLSEVVWACVIAEGIVAALLSIKILVNREQK